MEHTVTGAQGAAGDDSGAGAPAAVPAHAARPPEPVGPAVIQAGQWWYDPRDAAFTYSKAPGIAILRGFDLASDRIDMTGRGIGFDSLRGRMTDRAWAVEIDLDGTTGGQGEDRLIIKGLRPDDMTEAHFLF